MMRLFLCVCVSLLSLPRSLFLDECYRAMAKVLEKRLGIVTEETASTNDSEEMQKKKDQQQEDREKKRQQQDEERKKRQEEREKQEKDKKKAVQAAPVNPEVERIIQDADQHGKQLESRVPTPYVFIKHLSRSSITPYHTMMMSVFVCQYILSCH